MIEVKFNGKTYYYFDRAYYTVNRIDPRYVIIDFDLAKNLEKARTRSNTQTQVIQPTDEPLDVYVSIDIDANLNRRVYNPNDEQIFDVTPEQYEELLRGSAEGSLNFIFISREEIENIGRGAAKITIEGDTVLANGVPISNSTEIVPTPTNVSTDTPIRGSDIIGERPYESIEDIEDIDGLITANKNLIDDLNDEGITTPEKQALYDKYRNNIIELEKEKDIRKEITEKCKTAETDKPNIFKNTPECEQYLKSIAQKSADGVYEKGVPLADPCGKSLMSQINTELLKFFNTLKAIKKYGDFYVNGTISQIQNISKLIRGSSEIIGGLLKIALQRMRNWLLKKIRNGITDVIDLLLPNLAAAIKGTVIQKVVDGIFCKFKDIMNGLVDMVADFLFELIGKIVNAPFCLAQQWVNSMVSKLGADIDEAIGPILDSINDLLGNVQEKLGNVFEAIDFILGLESFLCEKPECPNIKSWIGNPKNPRPGQGTIEGQDDNFYANFLAYPIPSTTGGAIAGASDWLFGENSEFGKVFGEVLDKDGNPVSLPASVTQCDTSAFKCGAPNVEIFGGGGAGAVGNAVVNKIGQVVGVDLVFGGSNYSSPPFVSFIDNCNNGSGASGYAKINDAGEVTEIVVTNNGSNYLNRPSGLDEFDQPTSSNPEDEVANDYIVCLKEFKVLSLGNGYAVGDSIKFTPEIENFNATINLTPGGQVLSVELSDKICGIEEIPEVTIISQTGSGAILKPILEVTNLNKLENKDDRFNIGLDVLDVGIVRVIDCVS